jgi:hypothetical protein
VSASIIGLRKYNTQGLELSVRHPFFLLPTSSTAATKDAIFWMPMAIDFIACHQQH